MASASLFVAPKDAVHGVASSLRTMEDHAGGICTWVLLGWHSFHPWLESLSFPRSSVKPILSNPRVSLQLLLSLQSFQASLKLLVTHANILEDRIFLWAFSGSRASPLRDCNDLIFKGSSGRGPFTDKCEWSAGRGHMTDILQ